MGDIDRLYRFSFGDSTMGPIGACLDVQAPTRPIAVARLRRLLSSYVDQPITLKPFDERFVDGPIRIYINIDHISEGDIIDTLPLPRK
jgi:hypothetical protein